MDISEATLETGVPLNELPLKCRDHCHFSGNFLGAAHQSCNLNRRFKWNMFQVPVYAHNFTGYDSHLIIKELCVDNHEEISALAANTEKFKMIKFRCFSLMDSMAFLQGSLADLVKLVSKSDCKFPILTQMKHVNSEEKKAMFIRMNLLLV